MSDKASEYQEVAALVCNDLDLLLEVAKDPIISADSLRRQIEFFHAQKEMYINDPKHRCRMYEAACLVFGAAAAGLVRNDAVK